MSVDFAYHVDVRMPLLCNIFMSRKCKVLSHSLSIINMRLGWYVLISFSFSSALLILISQRILSIYLCVTSYLSMAQSTKPNMVLPVLLYLIHLFVSNIHFLLTLKHYNNKLVSVVISLCLQVVFFNPLCRVLLRAE